MKKNYVINPVDLKQFLDHKGMIFEELFDISKLPSDKPYYDSLESIRSSAKNILVQTKNINKHCIYDSLSGIEDANSKIEYCSATIDDETSTIEEYTDNMLYAYNNIKDLLIHIICSNNIDMSRHSIMSDDEYTALKRRSSIRNFDEEFNI